MPYTARARSELWLASQHLQAVADVALVTCEQEQEQGFLFVNVTGCNKGGQMSCDNLRKIITSTFGNSTATRSLRKGGALYYALTTLASAASTPRSPDVK